MSRLRIFIVQLFNRRQLLFRSTNRNRNTQKNTQRAINWVEQGYIPDSIIRQGIRRLLKQRVQEIRADDLQASHQLKQAFIRHMRQEPIALAHFLYGVRRVVCL